MPQLKSPPPLPPPSRPLPTGTKLYALPPTVRRADSETRGRHLVAARSLTEGELLFCERPMVYMQSAGNIHAGVLVCHYCMAFCGTPQMALEIGADPSCLANITGSDQAESFVPCRHACGQVYCSAACRDDDWMWGGHEMLCTGRITDEAHPLLQFKHHAITTNEIFLIVAVWIARIRLNRLSFPESSMDHPYIDFCMNPWWDVACLPYKDDSDNQEAIELDKSLRELCRDSHAFLQQAWEGISDSWLTPLGMSKLVGSLEQNCMGIRRKHAMRQSILMDSELRKTHHKHLIKCLERAGMIGDGGDDSDCGCGDDGDGNGNDEDESDQEATKVQSADEATTKSDDKIATDGPDTNANAATTPTPTPTPTALENRLLNDNEEWDYTVDEIAEFLADLPPPVKVGADDEWDELFTPLDGTALFATACKMNHSCEPNVILLYKTRGWGQDHPLVAYCVALRDIQAGEELAISYIISDDDYEQRHAALDNYGFQCTCSKCEREQLEQNGKTPGRVEAEGEEVVEYDTDDLFGDTDTDSDEDDDNAANDDNNGDDDDDDDDGHGLETDGLSGEAKLDAVAERLESVLNKSIHGAIPLKIMAPASSYVVQSLADVTKEANNVSQAGDSGNQHRDDTSNNKPERITIVKLAQQCTGCIQERDYSMMRLTGGELEGILFGLLNREKTWPNPTDQIVYIAACITGAVGYAQEGSFLVAIKLLDKAMIVGGAAIRKHISGLFQYVEDHSNGMASAPCPPAIHGSIADYRLDAIRTQHEVSSALSQPIANPAEEKMDWQNMELQAVLATTSTPLVLRQFGSEWAAVDEWRNLNQLVHRHGHRLVPIEIGSMYTKMTERLMSFRSFVSRYMEPSASKQSCWTLEDSKMSASTEANTSGVAYLAQHHLLDQVSGLSQQVPTHPHGVHPSRINVWMGTGGTRTPLHFDSYDNLLVQIVGVKYVRLYDPKWTSKLYVKNMQDSIDDKYASQGNMSSIECECEDYDKRPLAKEAEHTEVVLYPGDCLFIPSRHWHYVRSLTTSISVNYWF